MDDLYGMDGGDAADALDVADPAGLGAAGPPMPAPTARSAGDRWKSLGPLLSMLPLALSRGGRAGVTGLMQGYAAAQRRQEEEARRTKLDEESRQYRTNTLQAQRDARQLTADTAAATRRGAFLKDFVGGFGQIETADQLDAYLGLMVPEGQRLGVRPDVMRSYAQQALAPSSLQRRNARKYVDGLKREYGEKWLDTASQFQHTVPGAEAPVSLDQVLALAGQPRDPNYAKPADAAKDRRGYTPMEITIDGNPKPVTVNYDPDTGQYYAIGSTAPLTGVIARYEQPPRSAASNEPAITLTGPALDMAARTYARTGQLPPMGMGAAAAASRARIINRAAQFDERTGQFTTNAIQPPDIGANRATYQATANALTQTTRNLNAVEAFEATADKNAGLLEQRLSRLPGQNLPRFLNTPIRAIAAQFGNEAMAEIAALRQSVQAEYARIISQPSLVGVLTDAARREMETVLDPSATVGQLRATLSVLKAEAKNRRETFRAQQAALQQDLRGVPSPTSAGTSPSRPRPGALPAGQAPEASAPRGTGVQVAPGITIREVGR